MSSSLTVSHRILLSAVRWQEPEGEWCRTNQRRYYRTVLTLKERRTHNTGNRTLVQYRPAWFRSCISHKSKRGRLSGSRPSYWSRNRSARRKCRAQSFNSLSNFHRSMNRQMTASGVRRLQAIRKHLDWHRCLRSNELFGYTIKFLKSLNGIANYFRV